MRFLYTECVLCARRLIRSYERLCTCDNDDL